MHNYHDNCVSINNNYSLVFGYCQQYYQIRSFIWHLFCLTLLDRLIECEEGEVHLLGGPDQYSGIVTVCFNGSLTTVCNRNLDYRDATVLCRQAGFEDRGQLFFSPFTIIQSH